MANKFSNVNEYQNAAFCTDGSVFAVKQIPDITLGSYINTFPISL